MIRQKYFLIFNLFFWAAGIFSTVFCIRVLIWAMQIDLDGNFEFKFAKLLKNRCGILKRIISDHLILLAFQCFILKIRFPAFFYFSAAITTGIFPASNLFQTGDFYFKLNSNSRYYPKSFFIADLPLFYAM